MNHARTKDGWRLGARMAVVVGARHDGEDWALRGECVGVAAPSPVGAMNWVPTKVGCLRAFEGSGLCFLAANVAVLRAVAGMVAPGQADIGAAVNAVQTLIAA